MIKYRKMRLSKINYRKMRSLIFDDFPLELVIRKRIAKYQVNSAIITITNTIKNNLKGI